MPQNRDKSGKFQKGKSGNPGGRPAVAKEFREKCKDFMQDEGWDKLFDMARVDGKDQKSAVELIAAYAYGKPKQGIELEAGDFNVNVNIKSV